MFAYSYNYDGGWVRPQDFGAVPDQPEVEPVKLPEIPPEVWNPRPIDGQKCMDATRALCG